MGQTAGGKRRKSRQGLSQGVWCVAEGMLRGECGFGYFGWPLVYGIVAGGPDDALAPIEPWRHRLIWTQQCNGPAYHGFAIRQPSVQIGNRFCACCRRPNSFRSSSFQPGQPSQMASRRCFPSGAPGPDGKFHPGVPASYWLGTSGSEAPALAKGTALT